MHSHVTQPISNAARLICSGRRCERYTPFESGLPARTGRVYTHEIPGGQLSNLNQQAIAIGVGDRFEQIEANYAAAERILGWAGEGDVAEGGGRPEFAADPAPAKPEQQLTPEDEAALTQAVLAGPATLNRLLFPVPQGVRGSLRTLRRHITIERQPVLLRAEPR